MTSAAMIAFIDDFLTNRIQRTAIVLDNAPIHKSYEFQEAIKKWEEQDLFIFFLPTYLRMRLFENSRPPKNPRSLKALKPQNSHGN